MKSILLGLSAAALLGFSTITLAEVGMDDPGVNDAVMEQNAESDMADPSLMGDDTNGVTDQTPIPGDNATNMETDSMADTDGPHDGDTSHEADSTGDTPSEAEVDADADADEDAQ